MSDHDLFRQRHAIEHLLREAPVACGDNPEMLAHWARYICVVAAGFIENAHRDLFGIYARSNASKEVANCLATFLKPIRNPKLAKFTETAQRFSADWSEQLDAYACEKGRKEAIDSIMNLRHQIAHGRSTGVSIVGIRDYLVLAFEFVEYVELTCRQY